MHRLTSDFVRPTAADVNLFHKTYILFKGDYCIMDVKLKVMFLGSKSGTNEDGSIYYQGQFLEKSSNNTFRLYFNDNSKLVNMKPYNDYDLDCVLYINTKGLWAIRVK